MVTRAAVRAACRRAEWFEENGPCAICGSSDRLELDHADPATKHPWLGHGRGRRPCVWLWREDLRLIELAKCQALCHGCHKSKTREQLSLEITHGTASGYVRHACRCDLCRTWRREKAAADRAAKKS